MNATALNKSQFAEQLRDDIANNRLTLPTLPEVALQVREAVEKETATAKDIADMIAKDAALSARLLQVANSPLYRGRVEIDSIQMAVTRLGIKLVRNLVSSLAMQQMFQPTSDALDDEFRKAWDESLQVAAMSRVIAGTLPHLDSEQAMLAGLVHNIGCLPILARLDEVLGFETNKKIIGELINEFAPEIGKRILKTWHFPEAVVDVPENCMNPAYDHPGDADFSDVILVARLEFDADEAQDHWKSVTAFERVGMEPEIHIGDVEGAAEEIQQVKEMLS